VRIDQAELTSEDGTRLYTESRWPEGIPVADVAVIHGYGDHVGRYAAFLDHLASRGWGAHGFDYRGHGRSGGRRGYCRKFDEFHQDLSVFLTHVHARAAGRPTFLYCHSHGSLVTATYAEDRGLPGIRGVVFSAPWLGLGSPPPAAKLLAARIIGSVVPTFPFDTGIAMSELSRDPAWQETTRMDPLYGRKAPPGWFFRAREAQERAMENAARFTLPMVVHHGTADRVASFDHARRFVEAAGSADKAFVPHDGYVHELLQDRGGDVVRDEAIAWMAARLTGS
jgi:alpha-beta hydrolase superfamily lysophospholipase